jgi:hypothetical protein
MGPNAGTPKRLQAVHHAPGSRFVADYQDRFGIEVTTDVVSEATLKPSSIRPTTTTPMTSASTNRPSQTSCPPARRECPHCRTARSSISSRAASVPAD